jgi:hypothetical protein
VIVLPALLLPLGLIVFLLVLERIEETLLGRHPALEEDLVPGAQGPAAPVVVPTRRDRPSTGQRGRPAQLAARTVVVRPRAAGAPVVQRTGRADPARCTTGRRSRPPVDRHGRAEPAAALSRPGRNRGRAPG